MKKVGIIGAGKIGGSLVQRLSASGDFALTISDVHIERLERFAEGYGARITPSNKEAAGESDLIIVAVKPWDVVTILNQISPVLEGEEKVVVSVAAGVPISMIAARLPEGAAVLRVMPNMCAAVGLGSAVVAANEPGEAHLPVVMDIFRHVGEVMELPEPLFDAATALHGSGPAYVALFADALVQAGVREGIPRDIARRLVNGTIGGTAVLLQERAAHQIRDEVMTPGGTTAAAFVAMEKAGFVAAVYDGVEAATEQARRLAQ
ncbi:MAG TPA: pyrroline-5-carboxylate reductase [Rubrobacteraceae bacterium]|nr:pyrroline-5-carboxylate reductase [Rubrobacteraceae bacterium]